MKKVELFTDGACSGNPGKGGFGVILKYNGHEKEFSEGYMLTTNNRNLQGRLLRDHHRRLRI